MANPMNDNLKFSRRELRVLEILRSANGPVKTNELRDKFFKETKRNTKFGHVYVNTICRLLEKKTAENKTIPFAVYRKSGRFGPGRQAIVWIEER